MSGSESPPDCGGVAGAGQFGTAYQSGQYVVKHVAGQDDFETEIDANNTACGILTPTTRITFTPLLKAEETAAASLACIPPNSQGKNIVVTRGGHNVSNVEDAFSDASLADQFIFRRDNGRNFVTRLLFSMYDVVNELAASSPPQYHSDIKPGNMFLATEHPGPGQAYGDLHVRVGDFGLMTDDKNSMPGTPMFMGLVVSNGHLKSPAAIGLKPHWPAVEQANPMARIGRRGNSYIAAFVHPWTRTLYSIALTLAMVHHSTRHGLDAQASHAMSIAIYEISGMLERGDTSPLSVRNWESVLTSGSLSRSDSDSEDAYGDSEDAYSDSEDAYSDSEHGHPSGTARTSYATAASELAARSGQSRSTDPEPGFRYSGDAIQSVQDVLSERVNVDADEPPPAKAKSGFKMIRRAIKRMVNKALKRETKGGGGITIANPLVRYPSGVSGDTGAAADSDADALMGLGHIFALIECQDVTAAKRHHTIVPRQGGGGASKSATWACIASGLIVTMAAAFLNRG